MTRAELIIEKLGAASQNSVHNILKDKALCKRIMNEKPIRVVDYLRKEVIPSKILNRLIDANLITSFSNSSLTGAPNYIFENELDTFLNIGVYENSILNYLKIANQFILEIYEPGLTPFEIDIVKAYLVHFGNKKQLETISKKYNKGIYSLNASFHKVLDKIKSNKQHYDAHIKDLSREKDRLLKEVNTLKKARETLYDRVNVYKTKKVIDYNIDNLALLNTPINKLGFSVRAQNCLQNYRIKTVQDILEFSHVDLLKGKNVGAKTIQEIEQFLAKHHLSLK